MVVPGRANECWSLDFLSDAFTDGRRFRVLTVVDDFSRECLALVRHARRGARECMMPTKTRGAEVTGPPHLRRPLSEHDEEVVVGEVEARG